MAPGKRKRSTGGGGGGGKPGVNLLLSNMTKVGLDSIPTVTLFVIFLKIMIYQGVIKLPWEKTDICVSAEDVLSNYDFKRVILSVLQHADEKHLYFNMASLMIKGRTLESHYGGTTFALLLVFFVVLTNFCFIALAIFGTKFLGLADLMSYCTIGFSGVVFALKVVTTAETGEGQAYILGVEVPTKYAAWAELIATRQVEPDSSSLLHMAGIMAGCAYVSTPLGLIVDNVIAVCTGSSPQDLPYSIINNGPKKTTTRKIKTNTKNK